MVVVVTQEAPPTEAVSGQAPKGLEEDQIADRPRRTKQRLQTLVDVVAFDAPARRARPVLKSR